MEWLKEGEGVINIDTTFYKNGDMLLLDMEGDIASRARSYSPVPRGGAVQQSHVVPERDQGRLRSNGGKQEVCYVVEGGAGGT